MKDFVGNELSIGDTVLISNSGNMRLTKAVIKRFTKKKVEVTYKNIYGYDANLLVNSENTIKTGEVVLNETVT